MKIHKGNVNARVYTQVSDHYKHSVRQQAGATGTTPAIGSYRADGEPRTFHVMPVAAAAGRKVRVLKSEGRVVRRVTYK